MFKCVLHSCSLLSDLCVEIYNLATLRYLKTVHWAVLGLYSRLFNLIELVIAFLVTGTLCLPECGMVRGFKFLYSAWQPTKKTWVLLKCKAQFSGPRAYCDSLCDWLRVQWHPCLRAQVRKLIRNWIDFIWNSFLRFSCKLLSGMRRRVLLVWWTTLAIWYSHR